MLFCFGNWTPIANNSFINLKSKYATNYWVRTSTDCLWESSRSESHPSAFFFILEIFVPGQQKEAIIPVLLLVCTFSDIKLLNISSTHHHSMLLYNFHFQISCAQVNFQINAVTFSMHCFQLYVQFLHFCLLPDAVSIIFSLQGKYQLFSRLTCSKENHHWGHNTFIFSASLTWFRIHSMRLSFALLYTIWDLQGK